MRGVTSHSNRNPPHQKGDVYFMARCTCATCQNVFKSATGFDAHRTGDYQEVLYKPGDTVRKNPIGYGPPRIPRRCMTTDEMQDTGMSRNAQGLWIASAYEATAHQEEGTPESDET